jgi:hypothetical protein
MTMALTLALMDLGQEKSNYIEIGATRITKSVQTAMTDVYEFRAGQAKIDFVLGKSPKARFRVLQAADREGVLEVEALYTRFSIECTYDDVYKFEIFMGLDVELVSEYKLLTALQELLNTLETTKNVESISLKRNVRAA